MNLSKPVIPVFFSTDNNYAPFLGVAIQSLTENISKEYTCKIYVLTTDLTTANRRALKKSAIGDSEVDFVNVSRQLDKIGDRLHLRDYYTKATYYRFFIAGLFPQYKKALYLDCDIVVNGDITELYNTDLGDNLLAAVQEEVMQKIPVFGKYVERVLEMPREAYFNAGVLLLNLEEFRRRKIEDVFVQLLGKRRFEVTQDQDYLNVIAYGNSIQIGLEWNKTPLEDESFGRKIPKLVHYKINWKPWHYDGIIYGDLFWQYALKGEYRNHILKISRDYTDEQRKCDKRAYYNLYRLAERQSAEAELTVLMNA